MDIQALAVKDAERDFSDPSAMRKIIFLDVDGVLNCDKTERETRSGYRFVGSRKIKLLKKIVEETGAAIVLSSDWRYNRNAPEMNSDFLELKNELRRYGIEIQDYTPELAWSNRGREIELWLGTHPHIQNYVILDDSKEVDKTNPRFLKTTMEHGLTKELAERAIEILNGNPQFGGG